jgi:cell division transport system permease protein
VMLGILGSLLAIASILGVLFYIDENVPQLGIFDDWIIIGAVLGGVLLSGILISWFSTFFATQKFLNLRTDDLY